MHRKVQVFSMPGKVSIGQDRNKRDPHRGWKPLSVDMPSMIIEIEIKKIPMGDGNICSLFHPIDFKKIEIKKNPKGDGNSSAKSALIFFENYRNKKDPHRGRKLSGISILQAQRIVVNRNKKDPQRGRKQFSIELNSLILYI